jgi:Family of unknown function (DUF6132)
LEITIYLDGFNLDIKNIYGCYSLSIGLVELNWKHIVSILKQSKMKLDKLSGLKIIFTIVGATGGFLYWKLVGCSSGTCPIKSVWYWSTLWGMAMGYLLGDLLGSFILKPKKTNE